MHKGHMVGCVIAIGLAIVVLATTGGSMGGLGLLLAVLICPLVMGAAMWFLMGTQRRVQTENSPDAPPKDQALDSATSARG